MSDSQWGRVEELFHAALELKPENREAYLIKECSNDLTLKREVLSLIDASEKEKSFIEAPALSTGFKVLSHQTKRSLVGQVLGHFKILSLLGSGGMGDVYLAEDLTLERQVALKFLSVGFGDDSWAKAQLKREAKAIAQLENPNICTIHRIEEIDGYNFIEMQYVEGHTLQTLLKSNSLDLDRALNFGEQMSNALAAAHLRGIIHRDIKTQNIIVTPEDQIKVLDFGLAKLVGPAALSLNPSRMEHTSADGLVVGTVAYMSPEQARGEELGPESDVFSFGIVLNEILGGTNPFLRDTKEQTISAIQDEEPQLDNHLPQPLLEIIKKCLAKKREDRFENADEIRTELRVLIKSRQPKELPVWLDRTRWKYYGVAAGVFIVALLIASGLLYQKISKVHSLALVQIKNESGDPNLGYLSQGLTRNLFDKFNYLPRLKVKLPSEVPRTSEKAIDIVGTGRDFGVESVLSGEVFKQEGAVLLRVRLSNTRDGSLVWEQTFNTDLVNVFTIQDEIANQVVSGMGLWLIGNERKRLGKHQTDNEDALRDYMFGRMYWSKRDKENIRKAVESFEKAIALDPAFAEAYSGLSDCYVLMTSVAYGDLSTAEAMGKARWNAQQALSLNDSLAEAHTSMGLVAFRYQWDWQAAESEFRRAFQIEPSYATAYYWYAMLLTALDRNDEALQQSNLAQQLEPYSLIAKVNYGRSLYYVRRSTDALECLNSILLQNPDQPQALHMVGLVHLQMGHYPEAIAALERLHNTRPAFGAAALGYAYGKSGQRERALNILSELDEVASKQPLSPIEKALVYIGLGDKEKAFAQLNLAFDERYASLPLIDSDSIYDDLRDDPRFRDLTRRIGLPTR